MEDYDFDHLNYLADRIAFFREFQNLLAKYNVDATVDNDVDGDACVYSKLEYYFLKKPGRSWGWEYLPCNPESSDFEQLIKKLEDELNDYESLCINYLLRKEQTV